MNNYTTNPTMEDIDFSVFCDSSLARDEWEENFEHLDKSDHWFFYTEYGSQEKPFYPSELFDFSACTKKDFRAMCRDNFCIVFTFGGERKMTDREFVAEMTYHGSWKDYLIHLLDNEIGNFKEVVEDFEPCASVKVLYNHVLIRGYSQSDWANVIYFTDDTVSEECYLHPSQESKAVSVFTNYFYDQQVEFRLTIDDDEHFFEGAKDCYRWDKDEAIEWVKTLDISEQGKEWIIENLPDQPDYN